METSFLKALLKGKLEKDLAFPYPMMNEDDDETMRTFIDSVDTFCKENVNGYKFDKERTIPKEILNSLGELGVMGITIPQKFGGSELSPTVYNRVVGTIAKYCSSTAITIGAHQSIGYKPIVLFGTEEQKAQWLPQCATGEKLAAFALTEPEAGSDNSKIATKAELTPDGEHYILNGTKLWITNGEYADIFTVFARTERGLTCFIVTKDDGLKVGPPEEKLGLKASSTTEVYLENVKIPADRVVGRVGKGFRVALDTLTHGRLGLAGSSFILSEYCLSLAKEHAKNREQFKHTLNEYGLIQEKLGSMAIYNYVMDAMTYMTGELYAQRGADISLEADICKCYCTERLWDSIYESLQIAGGLGYMSEYPYERMMRDNRINQIFEGTNEIQRMIIGSTALRLIREAVDKNEINESTKIALTDLHSSIQTATHNFEEISHLFFNGFVRLYKEFGRDILTNQFHMKRASEIVTDLFALFAGINKTQYLIEVNGADKCTHQTLMINTFSKMAKQNVTKYYHQIFENIDLDIQSIVSNLYQS